MNILGISGSLREKSFGLRALHATLAASVAHGAATELLELRTAGLPLYNPDDSGAPTAAVQRVAEAVAWADAFILSSPDYHGSISGSMKNFLDFHWEALAGKLFGFIVASEEKGLTVMDQMRTVVRQCYGWSLPYGVSIHGREDFNADGSIRNERIAQRLRMLGRDVAVYGALLRDQFVADRDAGEGFAARYRK